MAYQVSEIVERAHDRTGQKIDQSKVDLTGEFWDALAEFFAEARFWWRRATGDFNTVASDNSYVLKTELGLSEPIILDEIEKIYRIDSADEQPEIYPMLTAEEVAKAQETTETGKPSKYYYDGANIIFDKIPDAVYDIRVIGWASVAPGYSESTETVPLVPAWLHYGLVSILERRIYEILYDQNDPRWVMSNTKYVRLIANANRRSFTTNRSRSFGSGDAVRSY